MKKLIIVRATFELKHLYTCGVCGNKEYGDTITYESVNGNSHDLLDNVPPPKPHDMPVGWSSNGKTVNGSMHRYFTCRSCDGCNTIAEI